MIMEQDLQTQKNFYFLSQSYFYKKDSFSMPLSSFKKYNYFDNIGSNKTFYSNKKYIVSLLHDNDKHSIKSSSDAFFDTRLKMLLALTTKWDSNKKDTKCSSDFFALLIGIIFSISRRRDWNAFINSALYYANQFLADTSYTKEHTLFTDNIEFHSLYQYTLNLYFSPTLLKLNSYINNTLSTDVLIRYKLHIISELLVNTFFKTLSGQENFYDILLKKWDFFFNNDFLFDDINSEQCNMKIKKLIEQYNKNRSGSLDGELPFIVPENYFTYLIEQTNIWESSFLEN